jgi:uncharacterized repeat protein (TIGR03837 family)
MMRWDIFCRVIDNFGDLGVCWRLAAALAARGQKVRLWVDDARALAWMAPQGAAGVQVMPWQPGQPMPSDTQPGDVVIEAFGCEIDPAWMASKSIGLCAHPTKSQGQNEPRPPVWINLEYLSAQAYVQRSHGLRSPVLQGLAQGMNKWFFYPGFTAKTGGLMRDIAPPATLTPLALRPLPNQTQISLFCYEPPALPALLQQLADSARPTRLIVMQGRSQKAVNAVLENQISSQNGDRFSRDLRQTLSIHEQTYLSQAQYDALLARCDLNFVRGEDSLVRALLAGKAFVWQIYPQADGVHAAKLDAFLDWLQAPADWREFHCVWNGLSQAPLPPLNIARWTACAQAARQRLFLQTDLLTQLLDFVEEKRRIAL